MDAAETIVPEREERFRKRQRTQLGSSGNGSHDGLDGSALGAALDGERADVGVVRSSWFDAAEGFTTTGASAQTPDDAEMRRLEIEINSLAKQLSSVKQRLGPASEDCARAVNNAADLRDVRSGRSRRTTTSPSHEFVQARGLCNPYEGLGQRTSGGLNNMFMNRSAVKLANLDALRQFQLTTPCGPGAGVFRFVDLCGAPGGFSEYLLRRCVSKEVPCRGYGMSLVGRNDQGQGLPWRLFETSSCDSAGFQIHICHGLDGTGDICNWDNVQFLKSRIAMDSREEQPAVYAGRVDLVVCDGGVDAQRDSDYQEETTQKLVVCQASAALELVRPGGTVVLKMFGFQTPVIRTMLQDMVRFFDETIALKPISSRPASAERYVVFSGYRTSQAWESGLQWQSRVFRADPTCSRLDADAANRLRLYLNRFDRDMLKLNLESCFAILSHLERRLLSASNPNDRATYATGADEREPHRMPIAAYRHTWRLDM